VLNPQPELPVLLTLTRMVKQMGWQPESLQVLRQMEVLRLCLQHPSH